MKAKKYFLQKRNQQKYQKVKAASFRHIHKKSTFRKSKNFSGKGTLKMKILTIQLNILCIIFGVVETFKEEKRKGFLSIPSSKEYRKRTKFHILLSILQKQTAFVKILMLHYDFLIPLLNSDLRFRFSLNSWPLPLYFYSSLMFGQLTKDQY